MLEVIGFAVFFITMLVEGLDRGLNTLGWLMDEKKRKLLLYTSSILLGLLLSLGIPELSQEVFQDFHGLGNTLIGRLIVGISLGMGSKTIYYLIDWIKLRRQVSRTEVIEKSVNLIASSEKEGT